MKETVNLKIGDKSYDLYLTIGDMRRAENDIGHSILVVMTGGVTNLLGRFDLNVIVGLLQYAIHDELHGQRTEDQIYELIQQYCDDGYDLDRLSGTLIQVTLDTGLFGQVKAPRKNVKTESTAKHRATSTSAPSKNG